VMGALREACEKRGDWLPRRFVSQSETAGVPVPLEKSACPPLLAFAGEVLQDPQSKERLLAALKSIEAELLDKRIRGGRYF
ncbi:hypothetical protein LDC_0299, partial [sediment metagenome]